MSTDTTLRPEPPTVTWSLLHKLRAARAYDVGLPAIAAEFGPVAQIGLGPGPWAPRFVVVSTADGAREALAGFDGSLDKTGRSHRVFGDLGIDHSFSLAHDAWLPLRRTLQPSFSKRKVATYAGNVADVVDDEVARWVADGEVDLADATRRITVRVLSRSVLGLDLDDRVERLAAATAVLGDGLARRATSPLPLPPSLPTPRARRLREAIGTFREIGLDVIERCRRDPSHDAPLVRSLLDAVDPETGRGLTDEEVCHELLAFLFAGHDTTATTLAYAFWQLSRDPDLQSLVAREAAGSALVASSVSDLALTVRVVHEALRLCPPAPATSRRAETDVVIGGYRVRAGADVVVSIAALHRDPAAWPDPERFDPDRFLPERSGGRSRWQFLPFGGGPRSCIGEHFAIVEATLAVAAVVRRVRLDGLTEVFPQGLGFTAFADGPVRARVDPTERSAGVASQRRPRGDAHEHEDDRDHQ